MKNEAGLPPMKQPSAHGEVSVRFASRERSECFIEAVRLLLHIRQRRMLHSKLPPRVLKNTENCAIIHLTRVSNDRKAVEI